MVKIIQTADLTPASPLNADELLWVYNGLDCCITLEIRDALLPLLDPITTQTYNFSLNLQGPVLEMTTRGVLIDQVKRRETLTLFQGQINQLEAQLRRIVFEGVGWEGEFNWRSPVQIKKLLHDVMGIPPIKKRNARGIWAPSTNREALEQLENYFLAQPVCLHMMALRDLDKKRQLLETGIDPDGRCRTSINIAGTNTGRLASAISDFGTGGNMQNIDRELRYPFVADEGYVFVNLDLEQADARNIGAFCWELFYDTCGEAYAGAYLDACESGDLHTTVCRMAWTGLPWPDERAEWRAVADQIGYRWLTYRDLAKKLGHGTNFYGQPPTMAKHTKVDKPAIETFQSKYFTAFPAIGQLGHDKNHTKPNYHNWVRKQLEESGSITTLMGRRRFFYGRANEDSTLREAIAYGPQSMTADEIDSGILRVAREREAKWDAQLLMQVHDSVLIQVRERYVDTFVPWALEKLRSPIALIGGREFCVPTEAKVGYNWGDTSVDKKTGEIKNPDGLLKWKGAHDRKRQDRIERKLTIRGL